MISLHTNNRLGLEYCTGSNTLSYFDEARYHYDIDYMTDCFHTNLNIRDRIQNT